MNGKWHVVYGPCEHGYDGVFGPTDWNMAASGWKFHTIPNTKCCGFGLVIPRPNFYEEGLLKEFIRLSFLSGFVYMGPNKSYYSALTAAEHAAKITKEMEGIFTLHHDEPEAGMQVFVVEIHDCKKFHAWRSEK